jgi:protein O-mannosyl-transferase
MEYLWTQAHVFVHYVQLLLVPVGQCIDHLIDPVRSLQDLRLWGGLAFLGGCLWLQGLAREKIREQASLLGFGFCWFLICLIPTSSFFPINDAMTERRLYLPSAGFFLWGAVLAARAAENGRTARVLALCILMGLSFLTWGRSNQYRDPEAMWLEAIRLYPNHPKARYNLGNLYFEAGLDAEAEKQYVLAIGGSRDFWAAYHNLGLIYAKRKDWGRAIPLMETAIRMNPNSKEARKNFELMLKEKEKGLRDVGFEPTTPAL